MGSFSTFVLIVPQLLLINLTFIAAYHFIDLGIFTWKLIFMIHFVGESPFKFWLDCTFLSLKSSYWLLSVQRFILQIGFIFRILYINLSRFTVKALMLILVSGESPYPLLVVCTFLSLRFELYSLVLFVCFVLFLFMSLL